MRNEDFGTAQSIIDAAGVTVPTGDLCQGCYDEQGVLYRLPRCIVSDPDNIVVDSGEDGSTDGEDVDVGFEVDDRKDFGDEVESGDELIAEDGESERRRDEKGKTSERDLIRVKARLSDRDGEDLVVTVNKAQNVGFLARKVQQEVGVSLHISLFFHLYHFDLKEHRQLTGNIDTQDTARPGRLPRQDPQRECTTRRPGLEARQCSKCYGCRTAIFNLIVT